MVKWFAKQDISQEIEELQTEINQELVQFQTLEIERNNVIQQLQQLVVLKEEETNSLEEKRNLQEKNECILLAKQELEVAYEEMKQTVTPKFTQNLSNMMNKISQGKYQNVRFDEQNGILVERKNGDYICADKLSVGTIDQLYLSLRLGAGKELSDEKMPILLDEAFAYFDEERLEQLLKFLSQEYADRQILILTCTKREKEI